MHVSGYEREGRDFYTTPDWVTAALLKHVKFRGPIWELCCGMGAMSKILAAHGYDVVFTDIADRGFGELGVDFFDRTAVPASCRCIVTNLPYDDTGSHIGQEKSSAAMLRFVRHAIAWRCWWACNGSPAGAAELMSAARFSAVITLMQRIRWFEMGAATNTAQHHHA